MQPNKDNYPSANTNQPLYQGNMDNLPYNNNNFDQLGEQSDMY